MGLFISIHPSPKTVVCAWLICEKEKALQSLSDKLGIDTIECLEIAHPNKRKEFLASRLLLKEACKEVNVDFKGIVKDLHGKPFLNTEDAHISISHSNHFCAAIIDKTSRVGVDIQMIDEKLEAVSAKFLSVKERAEYSGNIRKLCIAWSAKEAVYKLIGMKGNSLKDNISIERWQNNNQLHVSCKIEGKLSKDYLIDYLEFESCVMAYVIED